MVTEVATAVSGLIKGLTFVTSFHSYIQTQTERTWDRLLTASNEHGDPRQVLIPALSMSRPLHVNTIYTLDGTSAYCRLQHTRGDEIHLPHILMDSAQAGNNLLSLL